MFFGCIEFNINTIADNGNETVEHLISECQHFGIANETLWILVFQFCNDIKNVRITRVLIGILVDFVQFIGYFSFSLFGI